MEIKELFNENSIDKQLEIKTDDGLVIITNTELHDQQFELSETLCSEQDIMFGACETSTVKFKISNVFIPLTRKWITVTMTLEGKEDEPYQIGRYKVISDNPTADRRYREVTAYDAMHDIINADASAWYNTVLPNKNSNITMKQFRTSFMQYMGIAQENAILANDDMVISKTIEIETGNETETEGEQKSMVTESALSGKDVITAICEINGCFGHIGRNGKFLYIYLPQDIQGLYPANNLYPNKQPDYLPPSIDGKLYPRDAKGTKIGGGSYINCSYEDYIVKTIDKVQIWQEENSVVAEYGDGKGNNIYGVTGNFLVYGKGKSEAENIAKNLYEKIKDVTYIPFNCEAVGNPCIAVGEPVRLTTKYKIIESYVLQRTMTGIQSLRDRYISTGLETRNKKLNSVRYEIKTLKGKTNTLTRTSEETRSELKDFEADTESRFVQTAESIEAEVIRAQGSEGELSSRIALTVKDITLQVNNGYQTAGIVITLENEDGSTDTVSGNIQMTGTVTFTDLAGNGTTIINGNNITTGMVSAERIDVENLTVINGKFTKAFEVGIGGTIHNGGLLPRPSGNYLYGYADENEVSFAYYKNGMKSVYIDVNSGGVNIQGGCTIGSIFTSTRIDGGTAVTSRNISDMIPSSFINDFDKVEESGKASNFYSGFSHQGRKLIGTKRPIDTSDERLKKDIEPLADMESVYMDLMPISFKYRDGLKGYDEQIQYGFSAQKTKETFENHGISENALIWESEADEDLFENIFLESGEKVCKLDKNQMHAMHVQMIQKQQKKINALGETAKELASRLERLESGMIGGQ